MLVAHVTFDIKEEDCRKALDLLVSQSENVRSMSGCVKFVPFRDATNSQSIGVIHEWKSKADFAGYTNSEEFAELGKILKPMMLKPPVSDRFDAELIAA